MSNIYDISETPEKLKLKEQLLTSLHSNNKQSSLFNDLILNYNSLLDKYNLKLEQSKKRAEEGSIVLLNDKKREKEEKEITLLRNLFNPSYVQEGIEPKLQAYIKAIRITESENRWLFPENEGLKLYCNALTYRLIELNAISQGFAKKIYQLKQENKEISKENVELKERLKKK